jgi:hypothetical protein
MGEPFKLMAIEKYATKIVVTQPIQSDDQEKDDVE